MSACDLINKKMVFITLLVSEHGDIVMERVVSMDTNNNSVTSEQITVCSLELQKVG